VTPGRTPAPAITSGTCITGASGPPWPPIATWPWSAVTTSAVFVRSSVATSLRSSSSTSCAALRYSSDAPPKLWPASSTINISSSAKVGFSAAIRWAPDVISCSFASYTSSGADSGGSANASVFCTWGWKSLWTPSPMPESAVVPPARRTVWNRCSTRRGRGLKFVGWPCTSCHAPVMRTARPGWESDGRPMRAA